MAGIIPYSPSSTRVLMGGPPAPLTPCSTLELKPQKFIASRRKPPLDAPWRAFFCRAKAAAGRLHIEVPIIRRRCCCRVANACADVEESVWSHVILLTCKRIRKLDRHTAKDSDSDVEQQCVLSGRFTGTRQAERILVEAPCGGSPLLTM